MNSNLVSVTTAQGQVPVLIAVASGSCLDTLSRSGALFDDAAGDAGTAAAERLRLIAVIVAAGMDHHRLAAQRADILDVRRAKRLGHSAVGRDLQ
jgi:hypothetical protein